MTSVCSFVSVPSFVNHFQSMLRRLGARAGLVLAPVTAVLALAGSPVPAAGQTAHFDWAQGPNISNPAYITGTNVLSIVVDSAGDVIFTTQGAYDSVVSNSRQGPQLVPAAFHPGRARNLTDGGGALIAGKVNASSCTYNGPGSGLIFYAAGSNTVTVMSGLVAAVGLALDANGNLFVVDAYTNAIYEYVAVNGIINPASPPAYVMAAQGSNCSPGDMTFDTHGNLYYTSLASNSVQEILAVNGAIPSSPTIRTLGSGFNIPIGIAVDGNGDVFVGDALNNAVKEMVAVNGSIPASPTILSFGTQLDLPAGVDLDKQGDLYVADAGDNEFEEFVAVNGTLPASPEVIPLGSYTQTEAVALDGRGDVYLGYSNNNAASIAEMIATGANFGQVNIGQSATAIPMTFTMDSLGKLGGISVLTQGAAGLDFANAGSGTCAANTTYGPGTTCTVNVTFTPRLSGTRNGAVVLSDANGNAIATGHLQGTGVGAQVNFLPGAQSTVLAAGLSSPTGVTVDGRGNVYLADTANNRVLKETLAAGTYTQSTITSDVTLPHGIAVDGGGAIYVADSGNNRVLKETPIGAGGYTESTILSGVGGPMSVAVDGSGNVYITDDTNGLIVKEALAAGSYTQSTVVSGLSSPAGVAVDSSGNVYIADTGNNRVLKETLANGAYTQSILPSAGLNAPAGIALDDTGNVYVVFQSDFLVLKETPSGGSYVSSTLVSGLNSSTGPFGVVADASGNLYIGDEGNNQVLKEDFTDPPSLTFANTAVGQASTDSPQMVTVLNGGNAALVFPIPSAGNNPSVGPDFTLDSSGPGDCTLVTSQSASAATLAAGATCQLPVSFAPTASGTFAESLILTDNNLNAASPGYTTQSITLNGTSESQTAPTITWPPPAAITYGTPLGAAQLDATASVQGTFSYSPAAGTILSAGNQTLTVTFTPTDTTDYSTTTATLTLAVNQVTPAITWSAPAAITYGTALSSTQLDASANVPGTFSYSPAAGTVLTAGTNTLAVTFTPTDTTDYTPATASVSLTVNPAAPVITWNTPAPISYGTALGAAQLDAYANVIGTFRYSEPAGTMLSAGTYTITATFTPDTPDYTVATATVTLTVNQATPTTMWSTPAAITYGTALGSAQLDAYASTPGSFLYTPAYGSILIAGTHTLSGTFTPTDTTDYTTATATVTLTVNQATPPISWSTPAAIIYGTALGAAQLDASSTVAGTLSYSPAAGTVLTAGTHTLTATFTPTDTTDYTTAAATATLTVNQAAPTISWGTPAAITYGTALGAAQLDASSTVAGTFSYSPPAGTVLTAGTHTLTATFTPTDATDYSTAMATVTLTVNQAAPTISWSAPAAIAYGTALGSAQLDASSTVAGTFSYSPAAGTVLTAGTHTLSATFTPTDTTDYSTATASVSLTVSKATPAVTWPAPGAIVCGTALSSAQLDATANVPGSFAYSPGAGTVLGAGTQTLSVTFTPNDSTDYGPVTTSVGLTVNKATPTITWPTPAPITAGTPLGSTQLDATASVGGTFAYSPAAGTVLAAGNQTLTTVFTPTDATDYNAATASVVLQVKPLPSFTLSASAGSLTVIQGRNATDIVSVVGQNGFNTSVTLSDSGLPSGVTVRFGTNPTSGSSVLTFTVNRSTKVGTYSVTVKGVSGSLSASTIVSLTVER